MNRKEILFFKQCYGVSSQDEDAEIQDLLSESKSNRAELEKVREITSLDMELERMSEIDTARGYERMMGKVRRKSKRAYTRQIMMKACAVMALPLLISVTVLSVMTSSLKKQLDSRGWQEIKAAPGTIASVELPDRSKVWLNSGSTLRYPSRFRKGKREVQMEGEAYFEVQADKKNPFCVETPSGLEAVAYGTRFNVTSYPDDENVETTLAEGSVSLCIGDEEKCRLNPGECGLYIKGKNQLRIEQANVYEKTVWIEGKTVFRNATVEEVFERLGRKYNVDFIIHDPYRLSENYRFRITFKDETIQQVMSYLKLAAPIRYESGPLMPQSGDMLQKQRIEVWLEK